jgi:hypothetical protein
LRMFGFAQRKQTPIMFFARVSPATSLHLLDISKFNHAIMVSKARLPYETIWIFSPIIFLIYIGWKAHQHSTLRLKVQRTARSIMPRNFHRKDRHNLNLSNNDSATQPLPGWKQNQARKQQNWWTADAHEDFPRLGQYIVSSPNTNSLSQKQRGKSTRSFPSNQRDHMLASSGGLSNYHQKTQKTVLFHPNSRVVMLSSSGIKEYLLQVVEEGKRRVEEWINSEFEQASAPDRDFIIWEVCPMDWQPEKTVVIPQAVNIRYPWDSAEDTGKEW